jgi:hypothetical protein
MDLSQILIPLIIYFKKFCDKMKWKSITGNSVLFLTNDRTIISPLFWPSRFNGFTEEL